MKIEYNIEKIEDMYFDLQLTFKTRELESKIDFQEKTDIVIDRSVNSVIQYFFKNFIV